MNQLITLIGTSFVRPRDAAQVVLSWPRTRDFAFSALGLSVVLSVLLTFFVSGGQPVPLLQGVPPFTPVLLALMLMSITTILAFTIHFTGQAMSGKSDLAGALLIMAWMQAMFLAGQVVQTALLLVSPVTGAMLGFAITLIVIWVLLTFIDELNGFGSLGRAAFLLLMAFVGMSLGITFFMTLLGVSTA